MITLEDPIEYVYEPAQAIINQREVGVDVESYDKGLYAALREDPDVILIGEMRDPATIETALMAAETGHLVFPPFIPIRQSTALTGLWVFSRG